MTPRCGRPMHRYKTAALSGPVSGMTACGRPEEHNGDCRSREACSRYQAADVRRITAKRQHDAELAAAAAPAPAPVAVLAVRQGCGTFLGCLLHRALGERPCRSCTHAAAARWAEQVVRDYRTAGPANLRTSRQEAA